MRRTTPMASTLLISTLAIGPRPTCGSWTLTFTQRLARLVASGQRSTAALAKAGVLDARTRFSDDLLDFAFSVSRSALADAIGIAVTLDNQDWVVADAVRLG